jgi:hypothetical protein
MLPTPEPKTLQMQVYEMYQYFSTHPVRVYENLFNKLIASRSKRRGKERRGRENKKRTRRKRSYRSARA